MDDWERNAQAQELMKGLTGSTGADSGQDIFASALRSDIDPTQTENDAQQVLYDIGGQFDSGELDRLGPSAFSSMRLVALAWARMGWAKFQRGENLAAMQFLTSAWLLSQSGTVANRLGQVLEKQGQSEKARHMYALAAAAGGSDVADSRARLAKLAGDPAAAEKDAAQAPAELVQARTVNLGAITSKPVSARFNLVFDSSPRPERAEFVDGDESLRSAGEQLREKDFPVRFPDVSSVKIVRRGLVSCGARDAALSCCRSRRNLRPQRRRVRRSEIEGLLSTGSANSIPSRRKDSHFHIQHDHSEQKQEQPRRTMINPRTFFNRESLLRAGFSRMPVPKIYISHGIEEHEIAEANKRGLNDGHTYDPICRLEHPLLNLCLK